MDSISSRVKSLDTQRMHSVGQQTTNKFREKTFIYQ